ncbi:MAG: TMEM165/GDT1 family protein [Mycobacterium sp.]|nr:TMEM165/GDT1 family protein [Mycobacterium sp.]
MNNDALFVAVFLACVVEAVEAVTIVLAAGTSRGWRSTIIGVVSGFAVLGMVVAVLGPALTLVPLQALRMIVGGLLLIFGLQWLRKAILRASGLKALHDEAGIFAAELAAAQAAPADRRGIIGDWYAFTLSFKGVVVEGLEVAFIALTFGANQHNIPLAVVAALTAVLVITVTGIAVRAPLARVPENTMKFVVGVILTSFGIFWGGEGAGAHWPAGDIALLVMIAAVALFSLGLVALLRRIEAQTTPSSVIPQEAPA